MSKINSEKKFRNLTLHSINDLTRIQADDNELTRVHVIDSKILCRVYINNLATGQPDIEDKGMEYIPKQSIAFYFCINCFFAEWVENQLIELIQNIPYLYIDNPIFKNKFIDDINKSDKSIKYIMEKTEYFINVLTNFINKHSYNSTSKMVDISFFKLLVSTNILLNYVLLKDEKMNVKKTLTRILRIINKTQKFMAYNCDIISSDYNNKFFFSYSMTKSKTNKYHIDIDSFLNVLRQYHLVTIEIERCKVPNILLRNIIFSEDIVYEELKSVKYYISEEVIDVIDFFKYIEMSDNLVIIYWYMKIILDIIIQLICKKTLIVLNNQWVFDTRITEGFKIMSFLFTNSTIDDEQLVYGFKLLASNSLIEDSDRSNLKKAIKNYTCKKRITQDQFDSNTDSSKVLPDYVIEIVSPLGSKYSLEEFMDAIINRDLEYKCFVNIFQILKIDHEQNYMLKPYSVYRFMYTKGTNENIVKEWTLSFHSDIKETPLCKLVIKMYQYCVEYGIALTGNNRTKKSPIEINTKETIDFFECISDFMDSLFMYHPTIKQDRFLKELIMEIYPVLKTKEHALNYEWKIYNLVRIIYVVMIALDKYSLEVCKGKIKNNFLFNNVEYDTIGEHPNQKLDMLRDLQNELTFIMQDKSNIPNLTYSFNELKKTFDLELLCDCKIWFFWAGEMKTKDDIYNIVKFQILNPIYVYALYDIYFKYIMAILYCEFITVVEQLHWHFEFKPETTAFVSMLINPLKLEIAEDNILPKKFMDIYIKCLNDFIKNYFTYGRIVKLDTDNIKQLERVIQNSDIVIDLKTPDRPPSYLQERNTTEVKWNNIKQKIEDTVNKYLKKNKEIRNAVSEDYAEFLKLRKFYNNYVNWE